MNKKNSGKGIILYELACMSCGGISANAKKFIKF